jgi:hypothetical protein
MKVINLKSEFESFSWNDGLFAIYKEVEGIIHLWKISDGKLSFYEDGRPNITCTGINNKSIIPTDMAIDDPTIEKIPVKSLLKLNRYQVDIEYDENEDNSNPTYTRTPSGEFVRWSDIQTLIKQR